MDLVCPITPNFTGGPNELKINYLIRAWKRLYSGTLCSSVEMSRGTRCTNPPDGLPTISLNTPKQMCKTVAARLSDQ